MTRASIAGSLALIAALAQGREARAYCRSSTCGGIGATCMVTEMSNCSPDLPLQWAQPCVSFDVAAAASADFDFATADSILTKAFAAWTAVDCGGGQPPSIQLFDFGSVTCTTVEYNPTGGNANILIFRDTSWPHNDDSGTSDTLALTTVTFDVDSGLIYDADIEVNTQAFLMDTGGGNSALQDALTHEAGHFLGLAHSAPSTDGREPTMFYQYQQGEATLQADDKDAICAVYPPGRAATGACTGIPRHGWAPECFADQTYLGCAVSSGRSPDDGDRHGLGVGLVAAVVVTIARRATKRRKPARDGRSMR